MTRLWLWWLNRIVFLRRWTGCGGEGFTLKDGDLDVCYKDGCH